MALAIKDEITEFVCQDYVANEVYATEVAGEAPSLPRPPFSFLSKRPVLCGAVILRLELLMQKLGHYLLGPTTNTLNWTAHLYNAANQQGQCKNWSDMGFLLYAYKPEELFIGQPPTKGTEFFNRLLLICGGSATNFATDKRGGATVQRAKYMNPRFSLENPSQTSIMFFDTYCEDWSASDTCNDIEKVIAELKLGVTSNQQREKRIRSGNSSS